MNEEKFITNVQYTKKTVNLKHFFTLLAFSCLNTETVHTSYPILHTFIKGQKILNDLHSDISHKISITKFSMKSTKNLREIQKINAMYARGSQSDIST